MWYLYDALGVMYPQLMTAAHKAESEFEDRSGEGTQVRSVQTERGDEIMTLEEQIMQLQVVKQKPQMRTAANNPGQ